MSKEIKEILDELESLFEISEAPEHIINGFNKLKDYITNLQQKVEVKNERIKEEQQEKERYIKFYNGLNIWNKDLQQKVEQLENIRKEIKEYIEKNVVCCKNSNMLVEFNVDDLLDILNKGSNKE